MIVLDKNSKIRIERMLLVYVENTTPRIQYVFSVLFEEILRLEVSITNKLDEFIGYSDAKINYSKKDIGEGLYFEPCNLLMEHDIKKQNFDDVEWEGLKMFFPVDESSAFPFDPFAVCFYLVSRYEEYLSDDNDVHGRFKPENSIASINSFLNIPVVNCIAEGIKIIIQKQYKSFVFPVRTYSFIPSFDIDIAYAHQGKSVFRTMAGFCKLLLSFKFGETKERVLTYFRVIDDSYDSHEFQLKQLSENNLRALFFVLLGDYGRYDKNISHKSSILRKLLLKIGKRHELGIHPSYRSSDSDCYLEKEMARLDSIMGKKTKNSRQHFLRLSFPETYNNLIKNGVRKDYSMGYASRIGFRASICTPFCFYNLLEEKITPLKIYPFAFMDTAMKDYMSLSPDKVMDEVKPIIEVVRELKGTLIGVWHNYAMSHRDSDKQWQNSFVEILKNAKA